MAKKLTLAFSFSFDAPVWKTLTDDAGHRLFLELRDARARKSHFAILDLVQHQLIWHNVSWEDSWWIGLTAASEEVVILHKYVNHKNPEQKEYWAVDIATRTIIGKADTLTGLAEAKNLAYPDPSKNKAYSLPFFYQENHAHFATVKRFVENHANVSPVKGCEYTEHPRAIAVSYYINDRKALANCLLVIDRNGQELLHEKIDEQRPEVGLGTFFIVRDQLIFTKQKSQLRCYAL